ncbi:MAG TPA: nucleoside monophosphate kinase [Nanoarchaeota archaeon]|nr:nucleoside monophosphate kinase [Nanoarchaeota archaeon]
MAKILFIGPPGSGKGTQAELLKKYKFSHLSSGDLIRNSNDPIIVKYRDLEYSKGKLLSDDLLFEIIEKNIPKKSSKYILDGFIRTLPQAEYAKRKDLVNLVFYFSVDEKTAIKRILSRNDGRTDDNPSSIKKRFLEYREKTEPVLDYLRKNFEFYELDGSKSIKEVHKELLKILGLK